VIQGNRHSRTSKTSETGQSFVVFSLFSKKREAARKAEIKPSPAKAPAVTASTPAKPAATEQAAVESLDFSAYIPPPESEAPRPSTAPTPKPRATPAMAQAAAPASSLPGSGEAAQLVEAPAAAGAVDPVVLKTATLFANGQTEKALASLLPSVLRADSGLSMLQQWLMLFDLYQYLGRRAAFEALAPKFVLKFERSAPAWLEVEGRGDPAIATGGIGYCALRGTLSEASAPALEKLRGAMGTLHAIRIDCSKLEGLDGPGCSLLREALLSIRRGGKQIMLTGEGQLIRLLEELCQPGKVETDGAVWDLLLEIYRMLDLKEKFEEAAVNYAVTSEVSPPSWESPAEAIPKRVPSSAVESTDGVLVLAGEITGASEAFAAQLQEQAAARNMLSIDISKARRIDFAAAELMLKVFSKLQRAGALIQISGANELIRALFQVVGIDKVARINPRR
jgi:anti-anti-sigma regulatory factor